MKIDTPNTQNCATQGKSSFKRQVHRSKCLAKTTGDISPWQFITNLKPQEIKRNNVT